MWRLEIQNGISAIFFNLVLFFPHQCTCNIPFPPSPPYWIRHFEFGKSDVKFVISDLKNCGVLMRKSLAFQTIMPLGLPFWIPKIRCEIHNQPPRKFLSTEFSGNCVVFQNYMSDVLDILFEIGEKFFLAVQLFWSPLIIVRIKSRYPFGQKKNYEKKIPDFLVLFSKFGAILDFLLDQTQFWPPILQDYKETWLSFKNFSFSVMRMSFLT